MASETGNNNDISNKETHGARVVLQQCMSAKLMIQPATSTEEAKYVQIGRGLIVYICLLKGANEKIVRKMAKSVLSVKLSEDSSGKKVSVLELPGDILIIPQSTLGGSSKGKVMQYHKNIGKKHGLGLYSMFVELCVEAMAQSLTCKGIRKTVKAGTYGNKQEEFSTATDGPFLHFLEF